MAEKTKSKEPETLNIEPLKETTMRIELIGTEPLILHKRSRYYEQFEVWKQSHDKGTEPPQIFKQSKNNWEPLITSIHWEKPITFHDDDISLYSEEEWTDYMANNRPCILGQAFKKSFKEAFVSFYKETTKKNGTDLDRGLNVLTTICPVNFGNVEHIEKIVPTGNGSFGSPVLCVYNQFYSWSTTIEVSCPDCVFPYETVLSIIATTGRYVGIGTQRGNGYGRYIVDKVTIM